jgi:hypothetical protein
MRQSRKEAKLEWMMKEGLLPERREAAAFMDGASTEFADEWAAGTPAGARNGKRPAPGGRG